MEKSTLPPWGIMHEDLMNEMAKEIPNDWKPLPGTQPSLDDWRPWVNSVADELSRFLWPRYDQTSSSWVGAAAAGVDNLNDADFELLKKLHSLLDKPITARNVTNKTHGHFFTVEDEQSLGTEYKEYDPVLPADVLNNIIQILEDGFANKVGSYDLQLKWHLQRPRPLQVAFLQSRPYTYRLAKTAVTPSMVSGHCLQGSLAGCNAFAALKANAKVDSASMEVLKQFTVDIGDRRVFAGVHYPSDNISSWYAALRIIPHVFENTEPAKFLWSAVTSKSLVYSAIREHINENANSPYKIPLGELEKLAPNV